MNRRGFFGRVLGLLGIPLVLPSPVGRPLQETSAGEIKITDTFGVTTRYFAGNLDSPHADGAHKLGMITLPAGATREFFAYEREDSDD